jgi:biotin carboxyl carrier protein
MEFKVGDLTPILEAELIRTLSDESVLVRINGKELIIRLLKISTTEIEFILENSFHEAKILQSNSSETKLLIDGLPVTIKKHSMLTEVLEKSLTLSGAKGSENNLTSQIPGRVVSIVVNAGSTVKKGDAVVTLESMKMQVSIKAHKDGKIKEIRTKQGATVARYDIVAIIE